MESKEAALCKTRSITQGLQVPGLAQRLTGELDLSLPGRRALAQRLGEWSPRQKRQQTPDLSSGPDPRGRDLGARFVV